MLELNFCIFILLLIFEFMVFVIKFRMGFCNLTMRYSLIGGGGHQIL